MKSFTVQMLFLCVFALASVSSPAQIAAWPEQEPPNRAHSPRGEEELNSDPVWLATGEFHLEEEDLRIPGPGFDFVWKRIYRARGETDGPTGHRWSHSYDSWVEYTAFGSTNGLILHDGTGRRIWYPQAGSVDEFASPGRYNVFGYDHDQAVSGPFFPELTWPDMTVWTFYKPGSGPHSGRLKTVEDRNGNLTTLTYNSTSGQLTSITDTRNQTILIDYTGDRITKLTDTATGREIVYNYYDGTESNGSEGDLKSVRSPVVTNTPNGNDFAQGKTRTYTYNSDHNIIEVINGKGETTIENTYEFVSPGGSEPDYYRVVKQEHGDGFFNYTYEAVAECQAENGETRLTIVNDRMGNVRHLYYDDAGAMVLYREYTGRASPNLPTTFFGDVDPDPCDDAVVPYTPENRPAGKVRSSDPDYYEKRYEFDYYGNVLKEVFPNGDVIDYVYDTGSSAGVHEGGNLLTRTKTPAPGYYADQSTLVDSWTYHATFNTVTSHTPPKGSSFTVTYGFDSLGNRTSITYPDVTIDSVWGGGTQSASETFEYYGVSASNGFPGQLKARVWPGGRRDEYTYDNNGYLDTETVDVGAGTHHNLVTDYDYDAAGNLVAQEDPRGARTEFFVNELNQVVREYLPSATAGQADTNTYIDTYYDERDNVVRVDVRNLDEQGTVGDNEFFTTEYEYAVLDNLLVMRREISEDGSGITWAEEVYEYDANENRTLVKFGEVANQQGNALAYAHDERDLLLMSIRGPGTTGEATTKYAYDGNENVVLAAQGLQGDARVTFYVYDGYDRLRTTIDAEGNKQVLSYDANDNLIQDYLLGELLEAPSGSTSGNIPLEGAVYTYDERDRQSSIARAWVDPATGAPIGDGAGDTAILLDADSLAVSVRDDKGGVTATEYDSARRVAVVTDAAGNETVLTYDDASNVIGVEQEEYPDGGGFSVASSVSAAYGNRGHASSTTDEGGEVSYFEYDSRGNAVKEIDRRGNVVKSDYDGLGRRVARHFELRSGGVGAGMLVETNSVHWEWDWSSRLTAQIDGEGNRTEYAYDPLNRRTLTTYADGTIDSALFDVHDNVTTRIDANGSVITTSYDLLNRPKVRAVMPASGVQGSTNQAYGYDGLSRVVSALNDDSLVEREFDSLGNMLEESISVSGGTAAVATFGHDGVGNVTEIGYPSGRDITRLYDELNRLTEIKEGTTSLAEFDWQAPGRLKEITRVNGTTTDYTYDVRRRINRVTHANTSGTMSDWGFVWDEEDNKVERSDHLKSYDYVYEYDSLNRLVESTTTNPYLTTWEFDYDLANNRESRTVGGVTSNYTLEPTTPAPADKQVNQYSKVPAAGGTEHGLVYDANGNLTKRKEGGVVRQELFYDYRNQMVSYELPNGTAHEYLYDAFGRRVGKVLNSQGTPNVFRYVYAGDEVIEERTASGVTRATFVLGAMLDQPLSMQRSGSDYYYHPDDQGSVMLLTGASGSVVESYDYADFGRPVDGSTYGTLQGSSVDNPYYFTGRRRDGESSWYYYRTRYLVPKWGRFTTRDTIGIWGDSLNRGNGYAYLNNNPWSGFDPYGEGWFSSIVDSIKSAAVVVVAVAVEVASWTPVSAAVGAAVAGGLALAGVDGAASVAVGLAVAAIPGAKIARVVTKAVKAAARVVKRAASATKHVATRSARGAGVAVRGGVTRQPARAVTRTPASPAAPSRAAPGPAAPSGPTPSAAPRGPVSGSSAHASTPVGRRSSPGATGPDAPGGGSGAGRHNPQHQNGKQQPVQNSPGTVDGRSFSGHAFDQMRNRGLTPSVVENAIQNGVPSPGAGGTTVFSDAVNGVEAVLNGAGHVVSTW